MALIFEEFVDSTKGKEVAISQKASEALKAKKDGIEARLGKGIDINMLPGGGVLKKWSSKIQYNKKGENKKDNGKQETVPSETPSGAEVFKTRKEKSIRKYGPNSIKNLVYQVAGPEMDRIAKDIIRKGRVDGMKVQPVKPPKPTAQGSTKPAEVKMETTPNGVKYQLAASVAPRKVMDEGKKIYISESQVIILKNK